MRPRQLIILLMEGGRTALPDCVDWIGIHPDGLRPGDDFRLAQVGPQVDPERPGLAPQRAVEGEGEGGLAVQVAHLAGEPDPTAAAVRRRGRGRRFTALSLRSTQRDKR